MTRFACPYLSAEVELSDERERHITENHPELLPEHRGCIAETLADPDQVRRSARFSNARLFTRWFSGVRGGKYVVLVVVSETWPVDRHWIVTACIARKLAGSQVEWKRN